MNRLTRMPAVAELVDVIGEMIVLAGGVEPALGRALLALLGDDAGGVRACGAARSPSISSVAAISRFSGRSISAISRSMSLVGDVAAVLAQVGGDAVGAGLGGHDRGAHRIGMSRRRARSGWSRHGRY